MKIKNIFNKKSPLLAFVLSMLLIAGAMLGTVTSANASTSDEVSLYYVDTFSVYAGGSMNNIYIKVKNIALEKDVTVHYLPTSYSNPEWQTEKAEYVASLDDNYDIFKVCIGTFGMKYYITYTVNGQTYTTDDCSRDTLGSAKVLALRANSYLASSYPIKAAVKESGDVKVRYTTDNWNTAHEQNLSFDYQDGNDYTVYSTRLNLGNSSDALKNFKYAICYTRDGHEYWDNNFGKDFDSSYHMYR